MPRGSLRGVVGLACALAAVGGSWAQGGGERAVPYKCPGNVYTNLLSPQEAKAKGCTTIEGAPVTVYQATPPRGTPARAAPAPPAERPSDARVDPAEQRRRDSDARRILEAELTREQDRLTAMQKEYNNGEPERLGSERNYQRYLDRVAEMKAAIERKEADIAAIKRELAKLPE